MVQVCLLLYLQLFLQHVVQNPVVMFQFLQQYPSNQNPKMIDFHFS
jgi:hypothetical protein